jgi:hypothetical protein
MPKLLGTKSSDYIESNITGDILISKDNVVDLKYDKVMIANEGIILSNNFKVFSIIDNPTISLNFGNQSNQVSKFDHKHNAADITSGKFNIDQIPDGVLERLHIVADQTTRYGLSSSNIQNGDIIRQLSPAKMFFVIDNNSLGSASGYEEFSGDGASSVPFSGVVGLPLFISDANSFKTKVEAAIPTHTGDVVGNILLTIQNKQVIGSASTVIITNTPYFISAANNPQILVNLSTVCLTSDSRLTDQREPESHRHSIDSFTESTNPVFTDLEKIKLDGLDINANYYDHTVSTNLHGGDFDQVGYDLTIKNNSIENDNFIVQQITFTKLLTGTDASLNGLYISNLKKNIPNSLLWTSTGTISPFCGTSNEANKIIGTDNITGNISLLDNSNISQKPLLFKFIPSAEVVMNAPFTDLDNVVNLGSFSGDAGFVNTNGVISIATSGFYRFDISFSVKSSLARTIYFYWRVKVGDKYFNINSNIQGINLSANTYVTGKTSRLDFYFDRPGEISFCFYSSILTGSVSFNSIKDASSNVLLENNKPLFFYGIRTSDSPLVSPTSKGYYLDYSASNIDFSAAELLANSKLPQNGVNRSRLATFKTVDELSKIQKLCLIGEGYSRWQPDGDCSLSHHMIYVGAFIGGKIDLSGNKFWIDNSPENSIIENNRMWDTNYPNLTKPSFLVTSVNQGRIQNISSTTKKNYYIFETDQKICYLNDYRIKNVYKGSTDLTVLYPSTSLEMFNYRIFFDKTVGVSHFTPVRYTITDRDLFLRTWNRIFAELGDGNIENIITSPGLITGYTSAFNLSAVIGNFYYSVNNSNPVLLGKNVNINLKSGDIVIKNSNNSEVTTVNNDTSTYSIIFTIDQNPVLS